MIRFDQCYVLDGAICGSIFLDNEPIGEFRVTVPQWDELRDHETDDVVAVLNEAQAREYRADQEREAALQ